MILAKHSFNFSAQTQLSSIDLRTFDSPLRLTIMGVFDKRLRQWPYDSQPSAAPLCILSS
jgi:hypothetical protein